MQNETRSEPPLSHSSFEEEYIIGTVRGLLDSKEGEKWRAVLARHPEMLYPFDFVVGRIGVLYP